MVSSVASFPKKLRNNWLLLSRRRIPRFRTPIKNGGNIEPSRPGVRKGGIRPKNRVSAWYGKVSRAENKSRTYPKNLKALPL
jgi:hypothetical protein